MRVPGRPRVHAVEPLQAGLFGQAPGPVDEKRTTAGSKRFGLLGRNACVAPLWYAPGVNIWRQVRRQELSRPFQL